MSYASLSILFVFFLLQNTPQKNNIFYLDCMSKIEILCFLIIYMSNHVLVISSVFFGILNLMFVYTFTIPSVFIYLVSGGIILSILNHSLTINYIKNLDRMFMLSGFFINTYLQYYYNLSYICSYSLLLSVGFYIFVKLCGFLNKNYLNNFFHLFSHLLITFCHLNMCLELHIILN